jgi:hypothetical protein
MIDVFGRFLSSGASAGCSRSGIVGHNLCSRSSCSNPGPLCPDLSRFGAELQATCFAWTGIASSVFNVQQPSYAGSLHSESKTPGCKSRIRSEAPRG